MNNSTARHWLVLLGNVILIFFSSCHQKPDQPPLSPQDALSSFQLPEGYAIELVASEPLISDPVEVAFDENGKMYVVQMDDYPSDKMDDYADGYEPKSKISVLEDKDGDGFYESGNVYAEGLHYANGVMPWKGGLLVSSAPDILFLKDTDGDGRADQKKVVLTGFALTNPQLRMSSLRFGLDNWIYAAYSRAGGGKWREEFRDKGSALRFPEQGNNDSAVIYPGTNFRFRPEEYRVEASGGMSQFGLTFDSWGNQFTLWNNVHARHVVINEQYLNHNPFYRVEATMADISDHGNAAPVYAITRDMLNIHESEMGHFTSACGNCAYNGGLFTGEYAAAHFVCEPVSNLVHADMLTPDPPTFKSVRDQPQKEFLASTDSWFRPVNLTVGPDGALYVVDFYRKLVEHPDWLAMADSTGFYTHAGKIMESDFLEGNDKGRIYRIIPKQAKIDHTKQTVLHKADVKSLVQSLTHANSWIRLNAQRLLMDKKDEQAVPLMLAQLSQNISAEGKIHTLWTLEEYGALTDSIISKAFADNSPQVRKQAVLLAGKRIQHRGMLRDIINASSDKDPYVQFQVALTLSGIANPGTEVIEAQHRILSMHIRNKWFQDAILLGSASNCLQWFNRVIHFDEKQDAGSTGKKELIRKISAVIGARHKHTEIASLLKAIASVSDTGVVVNSLSGLTSGLKRHPANLQLDPASQTQILTWISDEAFNVSTAALHLAERVQLNATESLSAVLGKAKQVAEDDQQQTDRRVLAIQTIGLNPGGVPYDLMDKLLKANQSPDIQFAAAQVLLRDHSARSTTILISNWNLYNLKIHEVVESGFLARKDRLQALLSAIESGRVKPSWITRDSRNRLVRHADTTISRRATALLGSPESANRENVIFDYNVSTTGKGNPENGKIVFKSNCSVCHSLEGAGVNFGPDLHSVSHQTKINLLTMILNPNNDITAGYEGYSIETTDGETLVGIIESENSVNVVMKLQGGQTRTITKHTIQSMSPMSVSLMPEGLEGSIDKEGMKDLIEYIKTLQ